MPDGSIHADLTAALPQSSKPSKTRTTPPTCDLDVISAMLPQTPLAYMLMASTCSDIDDMVVGAWERLGVLQDPLEDRAMDLPVKYLDDAVALLGIVASRIERLENLCENVDADFVEAVGKNVADLRKVMENVLPFLAQASCISLGSICCDTFLMVDREARRAAMLVKSPRGGARA